MTINIQADTRRLLRDGTDVGSLVDSDAGRVSRRIYGDPEVYELEMEHVFRRAWLYLGHESEIPEPGDYVTRQLAGEPVILLRDDESGDIAAFLNSCRHRGMRVCRADRGNSGFLRCPYHGWTYSTDGQLRAAFAEELYAPGHLDKSNLGLVPVAKIGSYQGLIFATWNPDAPELDDYLGDMKFYLDLIVGRTPAGMKVVGSPQIWEVGTNWKFAADNFTGDNQHLSSAHGSMVELGMLPPDPMAMSYGHLIDAGGGHVLHMVPGPPAPDGHYFGLPPAQREGLSQALSDPQLEALRDHVISVGTVFPNFSFMQVQIQGHIDGPPVPFLSWRLWVPTSATTTRVYSWFFIDADADDDYLRDSLACYVHTFGPSGVYEQDDTMNWEECTRVNAGVIARRYDMHHGMNVHLEPSPTWPGPGLAYPSSYGEMTQLAFYRELRQYLTEGVGEHRTKGTGR